MGITFKVDFEKAMTVNGYKVCERIFGEEFKFWYTHFYSIKTPAREQLEVVAKSPVS